MVATVKALKLHGGAAKETLSKENLEALEKGMPNLLKHIENIRTVYKKARRRGDEPLCDGHESGDGLCHRGSGKSGAKAVFTDVFLKGGRGRKGARGRGRKGVRNSLKLEFALRLAIARREEDRGRREEDLRRGRRGFFGGSAGKDKDDRGEGRGRASRHHRQDAVFAPIIRPHRQTVGVQDFRPRHRIEGRCGLYRGDCGKNHAHAGTRRASRGGENRFDGGRKNRRAVFNISDSLNMPTLPMR